MPQPNLQPPLPLPVFNIRGGPDGGAPFVTLNHGGLNNRDGPPPLPPGVQIPRGADPSPGPGHGHQGGGPPQPPQLRQQQQRIVHNSIQYSDITPRKPHTEEECRKKLTTYAMYTVRKQPDPMDSLGTWAKAQFIRESLAQDDITKQVKRLNEITKPVTEKKAKLFPFQQQQVTKLLDSQISQETDDNFEWSLGQLDREKKTNKQGKRETTVISVYLKRAPLRHLSAVALFTAIHRMNNSRAEALIGPPHGQPSSQPRETVREPGFLKSQVDSTFHQESSSDYDSDSDKNWKSSGSISTKPSTVDANSERYGLADRYPVERRYSPDRYVDSRLQPRAAAVTYVAPPLLFEERSIEDIRPLREEYGRYARRTRGDEYYRAREQSAKDDIEIVRRPRREYYDEPLRIREIPYRDGYRSRYPTIDSWTDSPPQPPQNDCSTNVLPQTFSPRSPEVDEHSSTTDNRALKSTEVSEQTQRQGVGRSSMPDATLAFEAIDDPAMAEGSETNPSSALGSSLDRNSADPRKSITEDQSEDQRDFWRGYMASDVSKTILKSPSHVPDELDTDASETSSVISSYAPSILSLDSVASSFSQLSTADVSTSITGFIDALLNDEIICPLYPAALENPKIGAKRFERNFARLLKIYSQNLANVAQNEIEKGAVQLVRSRAKYVSQKLCRHLEPDESISEEGVVEDNMPKLEEDDDRSSEDELPNADLDDVISFAKVREFMLSSEAFQTLRQNLKEFVYPSLKVSKKDIILKSDPVSCGGLFDQESLNMRPEKEHNTVVAQIEEENSAVAMFDTMENKSLGASESKIFTDGRKLIKFTPCKLVSHIGLIDRTKKSVEDYLRYPVIWWPLAPRNIACPEGHTRISWTCPCGVELHCDLSNDSAEEYGGRLSQDHDRDTTKPAKCTTKSNELWYTKALVLSLLSDGACTTLMVTLLPWSMFINYGLDALTDGILWALDFIFAAIMTSFFKFYPNTTLLHAFGFENAPGDLLILAIVPLFIGLGLAPNYSSYSPFCPHFILRWSFMLFWCQLKNLRNQSRPQEMPISESERTAVDGIESWLMASASVDEGIETGSQNRALRSHIPDYSALGASSLLPVHNPLPSASASGFSSLVQVTARSIATQRSPSQTNSTANPNNTAIKDAEQARMIQKATRDRYLHWCVDASQVKTRLFHLAVPRMNDAKVFQDLKSMYKSVKRFRGWFSLTECYGVKFVTFERIDRAEELIACGQEDLPSPDTDHEYKYIYVDPREQFIKTLEKSLMHRFHSPFGCNAQDIEELLCRIPMKVNGKLEKKMWAKGYGMHAVSGYAFWKLVVALALSQIPSIVFAVVWLCRHPGDLQNAFLFSGLLGTFIVGILNLLLILPNWGVQR